MTNRQRQNLLTLANFIETFPKEYNQADIEKCIIGLGLRLKNGKLKEIDFGETSLEIDYTTFSRKYGVKVKDVDSIFIGYFKDVLPSFRNYDFEKSKPSAKTAAKFLRALIGEV